MNLNFPTERWNKIKADSQKWWQGKLGRPLIQVRLNGKNANRSKPDIPYYYYTSFYDDSITAEQIVDCWDYQLCQTEFMGDAYPCVFPNFGPGVIAAFLGANLVNQEHTVWFHPTKEYEIDQLFFNYQPDNPYLLRIKNIIETADKRWDGLVQIAMTDIGGNLDILSSFRPSEKLVFDLYDHPEAVKRLLWDVSNLWFRYFNELSQITSKNPGHTNWSLIFCQQPQYILQCDFGYMIGHDKFNEFALPELKSTSEKLQKAFYHLDGTGQLPNLDALLQIDSIHGIQWVPGAGQPDITHWPQIYKKISDAGKKIHIFSSQAENPFEAIEIIGCQTGRIDNIVYTIKGDIADEKKYEQLLNRYIS